MQFSRLFTVGFVWASCGLRVGLVWASCGLRGGGAYGGNGGDLVVVLLVAKLVLVLAVVEAVLVAMVW